MTTDPRTTAELLDDADLEPDSVTGRLNAIRAVADQDGVRVTVNVHGALVDVRIAERAMHQPTRQLAARITELAAEATRTATAEGLALVYWAGGAALAAHLDAPRAPEPADPDTFEPTSWAVPFHH